MLSRGTDKNSNKKSRSANAEQINYAEYTSNKTYIRVFDWQSNISWVFGGAMSNMNQKAEYRLT